jgi:pimeloyl-ACP methyl ester carboxylesterase
VPTLLVLGGRDNVIGNASEVVGRARRRMPQVEVDILPEAGHMMNTERPEFVDARVLRFLLTQG